MANQSGPETTPSESRQPHAVWLDGINRALISSGELEHIVERGVRGALTHPTDLVDGLQHTDHYDALVRDLDHQGKSVSQMAEALMFDDVQRAADYLHPVYEQTRGADGYVCLDVNPSLEHDTQELVSEGLRLVYDVDRANVMVQVPATPAGVPAIETLIGEGVNVNATHIYTPGTYAAVVAACMRGMGAFLEALEVWPTVPTAVASFHGRALVTGVDRALAVLDDPAAAALRGRVDRLVARIIFEQFRRLHAGPRWQKLAAVGMQPVRPLWIMDTPPAYPGTVSGLTLDQLQIRVAATAVPAVAPAEQGVAQLTSLGLHLDAIEEMHQQRAVSQLTHAFQAVNDNVIRIRDRLATG